MKQTTDLKNTYWNNKGKYEKESKEVRKYIPDKGEAKTPELNLYRIMANIYYDLYDNGLCNWDNYEHEAKYFLSKFEKQIKELCEYKYSVNSILAINNDDYFDADDNTYKAFEDVMSAAILIAHNSLKETSISNDSLVGVWQPHVVNHQMIVVNNGEPETWQHPVICTVHGEDAQKTRKIVIESVNNYNALKQTNKELIEALEESLQVLNNLKEHIYGYGLDMLNSLTSTLQKAKNNL